MVLIKRQANRRDYAALILPSHELRGFYKDVILLALLIEMKISRVPGEELRISLEPRLSLRLAE